MKTRKANKKREKKGEREKKETMPSHGSASLSECLRKELGLCRVRRSFW